jgi:hypothetical protein
MVRRVFAIAAAVSALAASGVSAEPAAEFSNPTPIDYSKPFLFDGVRAQPPASRPRFRVVEIILPVEVIGAPAPAKPGGEQPKPSRAAPPTAPPPTRR